MCSTRLLGQTVTYNILLREKNTLFRIRPTFAIMYVHKLKLKHDKNNLTTKISISANLVSDCRRGGLAMPDLGRSVPDVGGPGISPEVSPGVAGRRRLPASLPQQWRRAGVGTSATPAAVHAAGPSFPTSQRHAQVQILRLNLDPFSLVFSVVLLTGKIVEN